jgi:hypothetical protein
MPCFLHNKCTSYLSICLSHSKSVKYYKFILQFGCCGVDPVTMTNNDFRTLPTKWWTSGDHGNDTIPASCCHDVTVNNYLNYNNTDCTANLNDYHTTVSFVHLPCLLCLYQNNNCYFYFSIIIRVLLTYIRWPAFRMHARCFCWIDALNKRYWRKFMWNRLSKIFKFKSSEKKGKDLFIEFTDLS